MNLLAEFEFANSEFDILEQTSGDLYIKLARECRTIPFVGMKQPTPPGAMLGMETVLLLKYLGMPDRFNWELFCDNTLIQIGTTNEKGISGDLDVSMPESTRKDYCIKIYEINKELVDATD